jgi:tRNA A-37 threonylcarbamoyl transferase component Bud32
MDLKSIGKYTIVGKIGQGAMGEVYKALDPVLNRHVAIKTMIAAIGQDPELRQRFLREAQSAARLAHQNIVTLYDFGEDQGRVYMAMELLQGSDLKDLIKDRGLPLAAKLDLMEQVCDALAAAHTLDVVHRDIKPANIHVQPNNQVKIVDFGLARLGASEMTKTGMVMGTPHYMSPEQVKGERADVRSDVFSLGAVFYELLGHHRPFDADSLHAVFFQVLEHEPAPVTEWDADLPPVLVPFLARALAKDPVRRYQNAGEMRDALKIARRAIMGEVAEEEALARLSGAAPLSGSGFQPRVAGATALAPERRAAPRPGSRTLPGTAATTAGAEATAFGRGPLPLVAGGAALVLVLGGGFYLWQRGRVQAPPPATGAPTGVELVTRQLVMTKLELAQTKLEVKDYSAAAAEVQQVLQLEPGNKEALAIQKQVQGTLEQLDQAAGDARAAVKSGNLEAASAALERVLAIDPQHPVAAELSKQLDGRFRTQADQARAAMKHSLEHAEEARASTQNGFGAALSAAGEAETLFDKGEYTMAAQKFLDARDNFERARRAAIQKQAPPSTAAGPLPTTRPAPQPTSYAAVPTPAPSAVAPSAAPSALPADDRSAVLRIISDYERAIESKDLGLYRRLWPTLSGAQEKSLKNAFDATQQQDVRITLGAVDLKGTQATVRLTRNDVINGQAVAPIKQTVSLVKQGEVWTIRSIGQ